MSDTKLNRQSERYKAVDTRNVCIVGLGYVGLPLAVGFDQAGHNVRGYDISKATISRLEEGEDPTKDLGDDTIQNSDINFGTDPELITDAEYVIITVPTPVSDEKDPNLDYVKSAARTVGENLSPGSTVVLESTVFPGATREVLAPVIEEASNYTLGDEFSVGYSPERLVPGDEKHSLENVVKIVSGCNKETLDDLVELYSSVIDAGIHEAPSLEVAEAAKCIENIQRDINIALVNELAIACDYLGVDSNAVLEAAGTKWNFHDYRPGLVGGHCIPVDPFFFIYKAKKQGFNPNLIETAREVNEYIPEHVAKQTIKGLNLSGKVLQESKVLILGLTYKPNVEDIRTSAIGGTIKGLEEFGIEVTGHDPQADNDEVRCEFEIAVQNELDFDNFDAVILGAAHDEYESIDIKTMSEELGENPVFIDTEDIFEGDLKETNIKYYRL
ncbi:nucleotide sugar dehydrogenase [Haloferax mediterranei ATCC 33500]|nr:nucleotide sugar dehydrogenase [Haloferax mediterranei]MDX5987417.1 nucleotide sugar dehydrogenase [Haloferax mediterranei ATCC 33500]QCQ73921.1 nucleotide sugar dehydrogenase [Haloferax mediterranei ATCC 33500]